MSKLMMIMKNQKT